MFLRELELHNFRCFDKKKIEFSSSITCITGNNGVGKTSILEAIHYLCYLRSFRAQMVQDVMYSGAESFFVKGSFDRAYGMQDDQHNLQVGYFQRKKSIKLDQKAITSYKQILSYFQVITLTEEDIDLIKGYPTVRRGFIDQAVLLKNPELYDSYAAFKQVVQHRNALLAQPRKADATEMEVWNHSLWQHSITIQQHRRASLEIIQKAVNELLEQHFDGIYEVALQYESKYVKMDENYDFFSQKTSFLIDQERILKRSLFGAHLDDILISIKGKKARVYASRGQQKLVSLLCKVAWATMNATDGQYPIMLIDDFISDFDPIRLQQLVHFFTKCKNQIILTVPFYDTSLQKMLQNVDPEIISL